jgi:hypothetical protein
MNEPGLPVELMRSPPRPVRLSGVGVFVAFLAVALLAAAVFGAAWLPGVAARQAERRAQFERDAVAGQAEITAIGPRRGKQGERTVTYRFTAGGREYTGRARLQRRQWRDLAPGARVPVRYLEGDPSISYPLGRGPRAFPLWAVPLAVLPLAFLAALSGISIRNQRGLLMEGRPAAARVTASRRHGKQHRMQYEFRRLSGAKITGTFDASKPLPPGATVTVVYDRENPRRVARYPLSLVRILRD